MLRRACAGPAPSPITSTTPRYPTLPLAMDGESSAEFEEVGEDVLESDVAVDEPTEVDAERRGRRELPLPLAMGVVYI